MMKQEFEQLAGYEVSFEDYNNIIEPMYMAIPDSFTKADFVKMIDKKRFALKTKAQINKEMRKIANHLFEICGLYTDYEAMDELRKLAKEYATRFCGYRGDYSSDYFFFEEGYEYEELKRGCTYPKTLVVRGMGRIKEVILYA